jgi:hypothetical protein
VQTHKSLEKLYRGHGGEKEQSPTGSGGENSTYDESGRVGRWEKKESNVVTKHNTVTNI